MPKLLNARAPEDVEEERKVRTLAGSRHAPGDWIFRARIISLSWQGLRTTRIAEELGCEEMEGGADDLLVDGASQPAHPLVEEGWKLAGARSARLRPHLAQSGGFRMESMS